MATKPPTRSYFPTAIAFQSQTVQKTSMASHPTGAHLPSWLNIPAAQQPTKGPGYSIRFRPQLLRETPC